MLPVLSCAAACLSGTQAIGSEEDWDHRFEIGFEQQSYIRRAWLHIKGEKFVIAPSEGALGTFWWRWGDLDGELGGKKFLSDEWYDAEKGGRHEEVKGEEWVESEGENGFGLTMEIGNEAEIEFV